MQTDGSIAADKHTSMKVKLVVLLTSLPPSAPPSPPPRTFPQCLAGTGAWQRINTAVKLLSPRYPVFDLQDGQKYQFRVYSVNMYGSSEASVPSEPVQKVDMDGKVHRQLHGYRYYYFLCLHQKKKKDNLA